MPISQQRHDSYKMSPYKIEAEKLRSDLKSGRITIKEKLKIVERVFTRHPDDYKIEVIAEFANTLNSHQLKRITHLKTNLDDTLLHKITFFDKNIELARKLIELNPQMVNSTNLGGRNPIARAFGGRSWEMVTLLLKKGADANKQFIASNFRNIVDETKPEITSLQLAILLASGLKPNTKLLYSEKTLEQHFTEDGGNLVQFKHIWDEANRLKQDVRCITQINQQSRRDGLVPEDLLSPLKIGEKASQEAGADNHVLLLPYDLRLRITQFFLGLHIEPLDSKTKSLTSAGQETVKRWTEEHAAERSASAGPHRD